MTDFLGIIDMCGNAIRILPGKIAEQIFIMLISGSQNHKLQSVLAKLIENTFYKIQPLLIRKSGHKRYHHRIRIHRKT